MIEIKNVTFHYSGLDQAGLSDFNLSVTDGECILLCGASGCGKTTVTRLINGLIPHFFKGELTGDVYVNGLDIKQQELYNLAGIVGSVFQNPRSQFFSVDTDGEVVFGPENIGLPKPEILSRKKAGSPGVKSKLSFGPQPFRLIWRRKTKDCLCIGGGSLTGHHHFG